jgi:hypothetical protein
MPSSLACIHRLHLSCTAGDLLLPFRSWWCSRLLNAEAQGTMAWLESKQHQLSAPPMKGRLTGWGTYDALASMTGSRVCRTLTGSWQGPVLQACALKGVCLWARCSAARCQEAMVKVMYSQSQLHFVTGNH